MVGYNRLFIAARKMGAYYLVKNYENMRYKPINWNITVGIC